MIHSLIRHDSFPYPYENVTVVAAMLFNSCLSAVHLGDCLDGAVFLQYTGFIYSSV